MSGAADMAVTVILVGLVAYAGCKFFMWSADKVMDAIDWMTRGEGK